MYVYSKIFPRIQYITSEHKIGKQNKSQVSASVISCASHHPNLCFLFPYYTCLGANPCAVIFIFSRLQLSSAPNQRGSEELIHLLCCWRHTRKGNWLLAESWRSLESECNLLLSVLPVIIFSSQRGITYTPHQSWGCHFWGWPRRSRHAWWY